MSNNINLSDYILSRVYGKDETYTKNDVVKLIEDKEINLFNIVLELPTEDINPNMLYLVYNDTDNEGNLFDFYLYINGNWEQLDSFEFKITDYPTVNQVNSLLSDKVNGEDLDRVYVDLNTVRDNLTSLYNNITKFNEALIIYDKDNTNLGTDLTKLKDNIQGFLVRVNNLISELYGDSSDENDNGLIGELRGAKTELENTRTSIANLTSANNTLQTNVNVLREGLVDLTTGRLKVTGDELIEYNNKLNNFISDLNTLGDYLSDFEGSLSEFQEEVDPDNTFEVLNTNMVNLFGSIGTVRNDINGLQDRADTIEQDITSVNTTLYGANGDSTNYTNSSLMGQIDTVQGDMSNVQDNIASTNTRIDTATTKLNNITNTNGTGSLDTALTDLDDVKTIVTGDPNNNQDEGLVGIIDGITNNDGNGTLDLVQDDLSTAKGRISTLQTNMGTVQSNIASANSRIDTTNTNVSNISNDVGNVNIDNGGNIQNQISTLLEITKMLINCVIVDTYAELESLNFSYCNDTYAYVKETGKYYKYFYEVTYYDSEGNIVTNPNVDVIIGGVNPNDDRYKLGKSMLKSNTQ